MDRCPVRLMRPYTVNIAALNMEVTFFFLAIKLEHGFSSNVIRCFHGVFVMDVHGLCLHVSDGTLDQRVLVNSLIHMLYFNNF